MKQFAHLLHDPSAIERAIAEAVDRDIPAPLREMMDAKRTSSAILPFLAGHNSVDLWFDDWPEERKRRMVEEAERLAALKGTQAAAEAFLAYVDGELLDKVSHPTRFVFGRAVIGRTPVGHPAQAVRHLVKVPTTRPPRALVFGRGRVDRFVFRTPSRERLDRCRTALNIAKAPETESRVDFAHKRHVRIDDAIPIDGTFRLGSYIDRKRL